MTPLLPRTAYFEDPSGYWGRARWVTGLCFGAGMGFFWSLTPGSSDSLLVRLLGGLLVAVLSGSFFGVTWTAWMRRSSRRLVNRLFDLDSSVVAPTPSFAYTAYLPCNHYISERLAHGGVLYAGPNGLLFQPHRRYRSAATPTLTIPATVSLSLTALPLRSWRRHLIPKPLQGIRAAWDGNEATFVAPRPGTVIAALRTALTPHAA
jgi:hypothetical protein